MKLNITNGRPFKAPLTKAFGEDHSGVLTSRYDEDVTLNLRRFTPAELDTLEKLIAEIQPGLKRHISSWKKAAADGDSSCTTLEAMRAAITDHLVNNLILGWVFTNDDGHNQPYLITGVWYRHGERDSPAYVSITGTSRGHSLHRSFTWDEAKGKSVYEVMNSLGLQMETQELINEYAVGKKLWDEFSEVVGKQFLLTTSKNAQIGRKNRWWEEGSPSDVVDLSVLGGGKLVYDPGESEKRRPEGRVSKGAENDYLEAAEAKKELDREKLPTPTYLVLPFFHLEAHNYFDVSVYAVKPYEWNTKIRESLVLPEETGELLDALTYEMDLVQEDLVAGKQGGNVVMCAGAPGLGKTLTAEVYAEHRKAPLYKVHSGQLGVEPKEVEKNLMVIYRRAARWGHAAILLDEFDVFGRSRGDNLSQNAIVAVFLRTLEYQNNTIFLTTNRADDMDDAIVSRCTAIIAYDKPGHDIIKEIWTKLAKQFLPNLSETVIEQLQEQTEGQVSGRDIKQILRLANRYERAGHELTLELLMKCVRFRGIQAG